MTRSMISGGAMSGDVVGAPGWPYDVPHTSYRVLGTARLTPGDDNSDAPVADTPDPHGCRSAWWRCPRGRAFPARREGPHRPPGGGSRTNGGGYGARRAW